MASLDDLRHSITQMTDAQLNEFMRKTRMSRRAKVQPEKKTREKKDKVKVLSEQTISRLKSLKQMNLPDEQLIPALSMLGVTKEEYDGI